MKTHARRLYRFDQQRPEQHQLAQIKLKSSVIPYINPAISLVVKAHHDKRIIEARLIIQHMQYMEPTNHMLSLSFHETQHG